MTIPKLDVCSEKFDEIVEDIKQRNLSRNNMPKLIVGTGLSIVYGVPGMEVLATHLNDEINKSTKRGLKSMWNKRYAKVKDNGLEVGLANLSPKEDKLVDAIQTITAAFILEKEEKLHKKIMEKDTGFCKLLWYLSGTVSTNQKIIDVMTPNYDRIIELVCDKLGIGVITGFSGNMYNRFNINILKHPTEIYNCKKRVWVRLFKPHGSINWIREADSEYMTNDYNILQEKSECIEIIAPGSSKYRAGLINNTFRCMREEFNELLRTEDNYSLLFFGYGFNDDHFDTALFGSFQKNVLIISKDVKTDIINKAMEKKNITIFYCESGKNYMIYKSQKYVINEPLWDIDKFAEVFLG